MIPDLFHFVWVGSPMPEHLAAYVRSWREVHPDSEFRVWGDDDLGWLHNRKLYEAASKVAPGSEGQFCSDVARYEILLRHGGVYVDCDFEALRPIAPLLDDDCFLAWETDGVWVNNAIIGAAPGHELLHDLVARLPHNVRRNRGKRPNHLSGPRFVTPLARRHGVTVHPSSWFYPYRWDELDRQGEEFPEAFAVHHWNNARRRRG